MKQDRNKVSAITQTTYKLIKDSALYLKEVKETANQSINETFRQSVKTFENWLSRIAELRKEIDNETAIDILKLVSVVCYLYWLDNIEYISSARILNGRIYENEIPFPEKKKLQ